MQVARLTPTREQAIGFAAPQAQALIARLPRTVARASDTSAAKAAYLKSP
jgi:hypothetical protein